MEDWNSVIKNMEFKNIKKLNTIKTTSKNYSYLITNLKYLCKYFVLKINEYPYIYLLGKNSYNQYMEMFVSKNYGISFIVLHYYN